MSFSPLALLRGHVSASRLTAIEPEVYLTEHPNQKDWNFQRLGRRPNRPVTTTRPRDPRDTGPALPEIVIRGGRVHRGEVTDAGTVTLATLRIDGQLSPQSPGRYTFRLQSRQPDDRAGPSFEGSVSLADGTGASSLRGVELQTVEQLLPARARVLEASADHRACRCARS
ncbi:MAG: hypothetical protein QM770_14885 [Tepidisphaeraceae bacterium]